MNPEFQMENVEQKSGNLAEEMALLAELLPEEVGPEGVMKYIELHGSEKLHEILIAHMAETAKRRMEVEIAEMNSYSIAEAYLTSHDREIATLILQHNDLGRPLSDEEIIEKIIKLLDSDRERDVQSISLWQRVIKENLFWQALKGFDDPASQVTCRGVAIDLAQRQLKSRRGRVYNFTIELITKLRALEIVKLEIAGKTQDATILHGENPAMEKALPEQDLLDEEVGRMWDAYHESVPSELTVGQR